MPSTSRMGLIITVLLETKRPLTTRQIANHTEVSWKTAKDNLYALYELGAVKMGRVGKSKRIYWKCNNEILDRCGEDNNKQEAVFKKYNVKED